MEHVYSYIKMCGKVPSIWFRFLTGDVNWKTYGGKFISRKFRDVEFDYWFVMEVTNLEDATGDSSMGKYYVTLSIVAPSQIPPDEWERAVESCGWDRMPDTNWARVEVAHSHGDSAVIGEWTGNNRAKLMRQARMEAYSCRSLFGFYMDAPRNALGATGWDTIAGNVWGEHAKGK